MNVDAYEKTLAEVFAFCAADPDLSKVMRVHGASEATLAEAYQALMTGGAHGWERGHLVGLSALCFAFTLDYVLGNISLLQSERNAPGVVYRLLMYFRNGETGPVSS